MLITATDWPDQPADGVVVQQRRQLSEIFMKIGSIQLPL